MLPVIKLQKVTKKYPSMERPAVHNLTMEIKEGEICVFVGPSGCGKTTTLKMINRLIEPTEGQIFINGKNTMKQNVDELRQNIGYVIQQTGLFPHMTVYENIATVPRLKGWEEDRIARRVDQLLELVGLDPEENRYKYPRALSGGQKQRVGVARAMAADPPIMLMDEPFGAVDPITRAQLQNELLKLQKKIKKTICFVTHDIDEAIKLGDKIAIMNRGKLVQFDTPENILFSPANDFVEQFVGTDRALKVLNLLKVDKVLRNNLPLVGYDEDINVLKEKFSATNARFVLVADREGHLIGYINREKLQGIFRDWREEIRKFSTTLPVQATLKDALSSMLQYDIGVVPILEDNERFIGVVTLGDIRSYVGGSYSLEDEK